MSDNTVEPEKPEEAGITSFVVQVDPIGDFHRILAEIGQIDQSLEAAKGTLATVEKKADEWADSVTIGDLLEWRNAVGLDPNFANWRKGFLAQFPNKADMTVKTYQTIISDISDEIDDLHKLLHSDWMHKNVAKDETDALRTRRDELVKNAEVIAKMIEQYKKAGIVPDSVNLPNLPGKRTDSPKSGGSGQATAKVSNVIYFAKWDGMTAKDANSAIHPGWHEYEKGINHSLFAFRAPMKSNVDELRKACEAAGFDYKGSKEPMSASSDEGYEVTLSRKDGSNVTVTVKWDILTKAEEVAAKVANAPLPQESADSDKAENTDNPPEGDQS